MIIIPPHRTICDFCQSEIHDDQSFAYMLEGSIFTPERFDCRVHVCLDCRAIPIHRLYKRFKELTAQKRPIVEMVLP